MTAQAAPLSERDGPSARPVRRRFSWAWRGIGPFAIFSFLFLVLPTAYLIIGSLQDRAGNFTFDNYSGLTDPTIIDAYGNSIEISLVTAIGGGIFGFLLAYAVIAGGLPGFLRSALMTFSGVASNFAGVPLALAFVFTLGRQGLLTVVLRDVFKIDMYSAGFSLYSKIGLELVYMYFQFPLMVLVIAPAIDGLKKEWREASQVLGANSSQYWRRVALPILTPSLLGTVILLFGNSFGAQATAYQLTSGLIRIVTIVISAQMRGDVLFNPNLGYALAMGMVVIMSLSIAVYSLLQRRSERWLR